jgi:acyl-coenzyme A synthetase/AMP-(fatty) acid ligase
MINMQDGHGQEIIVRKIDSNFIRKKLSPLVMPQEIGFVPGLPKTRFLQDHAPGLARPGIGRGD